MTDRDAHAGRRAVIGIVFNPASRLLLGRKVIKPGHPFSGQWHLPGGKVEPGETDEQAVLRELREETGLTDLVIRGVAAETTAADGWCWTYFTCTTSATSATAGDDLSDAGFFPLRTCAEMVTPAVSDLWPTDLRRAVFGCAEERLSA